MAFARNIFTIHSVQVSSSFIACQVLFGDDRMQKRARYFFTTHLIFCGQLHRMTAEMRVKEFYSISLIEQLWIEDRFIILY